MKKLEEKSSAKIFGGYQKVFSHFSNVCNCEMKFAIYLPEESNAKKCPVLYWLSGLTCNEENAIMKAGMQRSASKFGLIIVCPDTSPRGEDVADEKDAYDFGKGAGFYVNATMEPWKKHFQMYSYITQELPNLILNHFPVLVHKAGIMGHSMGGHGALICALKNTGKYQSVSAFAPICHPTKCPWGIKAFTGYLGEHSEDSWSEYDAVELIKSNHKFPGLVLIDQGENDSFLSSGQLLLNDLEEVCAKNNVPIKVNIRNGYDHSYYFITTFIESHLEFHSKNLCSPESGE